MGLLTDPGAGRGKLTQLLVAYHNKLCVLLYIGGVTWFIILAHDNFNAGTYFSENALLPGLVKGEFDKDAAAKQYQSELLDEAARYPDGVPYSWLLAKFRQLNLDVYTHNFTVHNPLGLRTKYSGKNVYAILRAPRSSSTEALVLSAPYRPPNSVHPGTIPSIAIMLALAKFFRRQKYWAKDVIFLVTEHEQLGVQAWLEAYHKASCGRSGVLDHGDMMGREEQSSCAAQQLNASQSTHRFSFVNHTIKTVNMPKVRHSVNLKSKLTSYISEFKEDGLSTDNKILFCNLCQCAVSSTQKFLVQQHITTSKHQANKQLNSKQRQLFLTQPTTSNVRSEFNIDLCRSLISADIPLYKLKNKVFREFLEKYTQHTIPDESTLRKTYAPSIYDETIQKIRDEIKDSSIWVSIDETPDKEGRLVGNVVIGLLSEQYSERILLHCDVLEKCNNKTIVKLFNEAMGILWPKGIMYDNVLFFISDAAPYMVKAGQALSVVYPKLTHFTCVAHAFHPPSRVNVLKEMYPEIPLPPKPILTRWGTWLEAVEYYAEHIDSINNVLLALDSEDAVSIDTAKTVTCDISVKNDLAHIQHTFSCIIKTLKSLQNRHLSLSESFEIINSTVEQLNRGRGKVADAVRAKVDTVLSKTLDMKNYKKVVAVMSGESTVKINLDLSPADIVKLNYVPVTSCDVERSFSQYKSILRDNRRRFTFQHLKEMFAAINLELHAEKIGYIDVKIEGLNGQLPNLDLVNLVHRMCSKEGVRHTFKNRENSNYRDSFKEWQHSFKTLMAMVTTQATGVPNGNHGLFHRFGIEAVTLEGFEKKGKGNPALYFHIGRVLEGLFRSLNNLLERFHQSYFFYLLPATDRYISIGMYMPPLGLLCAGLVIKAFALWLKMQEDSTKLEPVEKKDKEDEVKNRNREEKGSSKYFSLVPVGVTVLATHALGILLLSAPQALSSFGLEFGLSTEISLYVGYLVMSLSMLLLPLFARNNVGSTVESWTLLNIVALLELGTLLLCISMQNFSLALLSAVLYVPPGLWMVPTRNRMVGILQKLFWLLLHPLTLLTIVVMCNTALMFSEEPPAEILERGISATRHALVYAVVDSYIYANWVFPVTTAILLPNWLLFWVVLHSSPHQEEIKKTNGG
ncbi:hypothetical protein ANN_25962 [Periplaneta americana]|uniref:DUF659 domain-containing protein n=1 Tax=Periplaneta americana TaxID=6978 RepID=A0ABQ8S4M9_PERAM|nr:hypothetical protein ANN_25962 [Periplaneta americana]